MGSDMLENQKLQEYFIQILGENLVKTDAPMSEYTTFRAGGRAKFLLGVKNEEQLKAVIAKLGEVGINTMIIGAGSNILVQDGGFDGAFVKLVGNFANIDARGCEIEAGAGLKLSALSAFARDNSLSGLEFACGIPGSVGGGIFMNAGAYGGEIAQVIKSVKVLTKYGEILKLDNQDIDFSYRNSRFQNTEEIILSAIFSLKIGAEEEISNEMKDLMQRRNTKQPVNMPSAGSFFKRPESGYAGKLIEDAGLKGFGVGDAQVSSLHSGFIVNKGKAKASDIIELMHIVQKTVKDKFDVSLNPEVRIVGRSE